MKQDAAPRILLCGDVRGHVDQLYKRFASVNKANGPFDALFCVGQFFSDENDEEMQAYSDEKKEVPVPTYFIGNYGEKSSHLLEGAKENAQNLGLVTDGIPVCTNLYWLKGSGILNIKGLRIAYLGGKSDSSAYQDAKRASDIGAFHEDDVDALRAVADEPFITDLFLSNEWPEGILRAANPEHFPAGCDEVTGNPLIAELAAELKPRYHIAGTGGLFYTREPYCNEGASHITRFVALGAVGNDKKQKYLHALSPTPASNLDPSELAVKPPNTTNSPYQPPPNLVETPQESKKRFSSELQEEEQQDGQYWRYDSSEGAKKQKRNEGMCFEYMSKGICSRGRSCKYKHDLGTGQPIPRNACYDFVIKGSCERGSDCRFQHTLSDEAAGSSSSVCFNFMNRGKCEKGANCRFSHSSESRAAGSEPCWFCLSSPKVESHLVISIGDHCYCALAKGPLVNDHVLIPPIEHLPSTSSLPQSAESEVQTYKDALRKFFTSQGKAMIVFERYVPLRAATHAHLQVVPIPTETAFTSQAAFESAASELGFEFQVIADGDKKALQRLLDGVNYFFVEFPDGTILAYPFSPGDRKMPLQFGREVIAGVLGTPEKADWKACKLTTEEEILLVEAFKNQFAAFDPMQSTDL